MENSLQMGSSETLPQVSKTALREMREKILALEAKMLAMPKEHQIQLEPTHHFAPGLYLRELFIPAGVTLTGAIHRTEHMCILAQGRVSVCGMGEKPEVYQAPCVVRSMPGAKRAIYAHEDSTWINVHHNPTNEQDPEKIWDIYTAKTFEEALGAPAEQAQLEEGI